jgi:hypothetical protein
VFLNDKLISQNIRRDIFGAGWPSYYEYSYTQKNKQEYHRCKRYTITGLGRPLGLQEGEGLRISGQAVNEGGKVVKPGHRPPFSSEDIPGIHIC